MHNKNVRLQVLTWVPGQEHSIHCRGIAYTCHPDKFQQVARNVRPDKKRKNWTRSLRLRKKGENRERKRWYVMSFRLSMPWSFTVYVWKRFRLPISRPITLMLRQLDALGLHLFGLPKKISGCFVRHRYMHKQSIWNNSVLFDFDAVWTVQILFAICQSLRLHRNSRVTLLSWRTKVPSIDEISRSKKDS